MTPVGRRDKLEGLNERRNQVRVTIDAAAQVAVGQSGPLKGTVANVSHRGLFLKASVNPVMHKPAHVTFILRPDHTLCEASGKVAWTAPHGIGVFFDEINDAFVDYVDQLVAASKSTNEAAKRALVERILDAIDIEIS